MERTESMTPPTWSPLYRTTAWLCALMVGLIVVQVGVFVAWPPPTTVEGFYELLIANPLLGLVSLDLLYVVQNTILAVIYVALFVRMRAESPTLSVLGLTWGLLGIAAYYPSNPAFELLALSRERATSGPDVSASLVAAGEAVLAGYTGTSFSVYYVLSAVALVLFAIAILRTRRLSAATGWWGLAAGALMIVPSSAGAVGTAFALASLAPWTVFVVLLALRFRALSKQG
ncbi:hypothetical protein [Agromyces sp. Soil535]|uniref:hypothetical protein n=1 Tax=Agromyces sp. Soil535 TaxID=1736390 RepID=UPI0006FAA61C|nr:hypothetical protein [Agromyces sp. Soil535]KRE23058.1 hypothetical protein ASG80_09400 [Agromyces sp. Soil535]